LGEPDFNTSLLLKNAKQAVDILPYLFSSGWLWRPHAAENLKEITQTCKIVVFNRTKQSLYNIAQVMLNDGDEVIYLHLTGFLISK
jgi:aspartate aminotransferase